MTTLEQKVRQFGLNNLSELLEITPGALVHRISVLNVTIAELYTLRKVLEMDNEAVKELFEI